MGEAPKNALLSVLDKISAEKGQHYLYIAIRSTLTLVQPLNEVLAAAGATNQPDDISQKSDIMMVCKLSVLSAALL